DYKIIFMEREMDEVLKSQQVMLNRSDKNAYPAILAGTFDKQLKNIKEWIERQPNIEVLYIDYAEAVNNSQKTAEEIEQFLGEDLNIQAMSVAVDKSLYRNSKPVWN
ncbi:MAG TPA: sulfotransferase domain-containing protein, partial [Cytophagaceae bacterium]|nr:sulfotransferase domain-containing protein [Cytophagaceae bacterium]